MLDFLSNFFIVVLCVFVSLLLTFCMVEIIRRSETKKPNGVGVAMLYAVPFNLIYATIASNILDYVLVEDYYISFLEVFLILTAGDLLTLLYREYKGKR